MRTISRKGFTLVELLVVISIISLLASTVLSTLSGVRDKARVAAGREFNAIVYHTIGDMAVGVWSFDECSGTAVSDTSSLGNNGTVGSTLWSSDTPTGSGCSLSFSTSYVSVGTSNMPNIESPKTFSVWIKYNGVPGGSTINLFAGGSNSIQMGFSGGTAFRVWKYGGSALVSLPSLFSSGVWHQVVYTYDGTNHILYLDGAEKARSTSVSGQSGQTVSASLGGSVYDNLIGMLDDARVYSSTISAQEVGRLYADGLSAHRPMADISTLIRPKI
ncbi:MAG: LamG-like jellyroll fold domain-containing protein [Candidatus Paceibacterota bacterium]